MNIFGCFSCFHSKYKPASELVRSDVDTATLLCASEPFQVVAPESSGSAPVVIRSIRMPDIPSFPPRAQPIRIYRGLHSEALFRMSNAILSPALSHNPRLFLTFAMDALPTKRDQNPHLSLRSIFAPLPRRPGWRFLGCEPSIDKMLVRHHKMACEKYRNVEKLVKRLDARQAQAEGQFGAQGQLIEGQLMELRAQISSAVNLLHHALMQLAITASTADQEYQERIEARTT